MSNLRNSIGGLDAAVVALRDSARRDDKTALLNALALAEDAKELVANLGKTYVLFFGDVNRFKSINARAGHQGGDAVLNRVGGLLGLTADEFGAAAYRKSGDEFVLLVESGKAGLLAEALSRRFEKCHLDYQGTTYAYSMSFGFVLAKDAAYEILQRRAEVACNAAKDRGDGQVVEWTADLEGHLPVERRFRCPCGIGGDLRVPRLRAASGLACPGCGNTLQDQT